MLRWLIWWGDGATDVSGAVLTRLSGNTYTLTRVAMTDEADLDNDYTFEYYVEVPSSTTRVLGAASGLSLTGYFSLTRTGTALAGTSTTMTEASGKLGQYFGNLDQGAVNTALAAYEGSQIWEVVTDSANINVGTLVLVTRRSP